MSHKPPVYDMPHPKLPRAAGGALRLLTALAESPITRMLLVPTLLTNAGIPQLRALRVVEPPTYMPLHDFEPPARKPAPVRLDKIPKLPRRPEAAFRFNSVRDYAEAYRQNTLSPIEVAERALAAMASSDQANPPLRVFISSHPDEVLAAAEAATQRIRTNKPLGPFDGVPVAIKDEVDVAGYGTTVGTKVFGKTPAAQDCTVAARLRAAGAVILGKANMAEYGLVTTGLNIPYGTARNPFNPAHHTGGSSSGPAAAVAAGLCPVAIGVDGGGSIRIPSAFCGLVGIMSTKGRVSGFGAAPIDRTVGHLGPLAATAEDAALTYAVIAGVDPNDIDTAHQPPVTLDGLDNAKLSDLTLGIFPEWFDDADPEVVSICRAMVESLEKLGATIKEVAIPDMGAAYVAHAVTILSELASAMLMVPPEAYRDLSPEVRLQFVAAREMNPLDFVQAQRVRTQTMRHYDDIFQQVDALLAPATPFPAPPVPADALSDGVSDLTQVIATLRFANQANLCGLPAISFPAGFASNGLPVGFQAVGRPWTESTLLRLAYAADSLIERRRPQVYFDLLA